MKRFGTGSLSSEFFFFGENKMFSAARWRVQEGKGRKVELHKTTALRFNFSNQNRIHW